MSTISPNMQLIVPAVGVTPGPDYATEQNTSFQIIDSHDHTLGKGVPITPSGMSINADLNFFTNNAINLRSTRYTPQLSALNAPTDLGCLYVAGSDLYFNDVAGNQIRLTQGGSIVGTAGSISGLPSGTASASFSVNTFIWQASTNVGAYMDSSSVTIREAVTNGNGATLQTVSSLAGNYTLVLPTLPASQKIMTLDNLGNITAPWAVDGSTIVVSSNTIKVPDSGINTAQIADNAVTTPKIADGNVTNAKLAPSVYGQGTAVNVGTSPAAQVTLVTSNRPVLITVCVDFPFAVTASQALTVSLHRGGAPFLTLLTFAAAGNLNMNTQTIIDTAPGVGTQIYDIRTTVGTATANNQFRLTAVEIK